MKFPLHLLLASSAAPLSVSSYVTSATASRLLHRTTTTTRTSSICLHYKEPGNSDDSSSSSSADSSSKNTWSVLANTERWISDTLDSSNKAETDRQDAAEKLKRQKEQDTKLPHFADAKNPESPSPPRVDNPYARKEVTYVCETGEDCVGVVGGMFRQVREARELGESHGRGVEARLGDTNSQPATMRQTNVVVMPNCDELSTSFHTFDKLVQSINQARRASRDFVLKKKENDDGSKDWVVSINCAHLHPQYGKQTPAEQLAQLKAEEEAGEVDVHLEEYKKSRMAARQSPYPSVIVEVMSTPPPDFGVNLDTEAGAAHQAALDAAEKNMHIMENKKKVDADDDVTSADVRRLEALFGMSAAKKEGSVDDTFYDALGEAFGNEQIVPETPLSKAQHWVLANDPQFDAGTSVFTNSNTRHVDAAYEYIFNNIAMMLHSSDTDDSESVFKHGQDQKSYVVLPNFVPTSATSFDRFAGQVSNIIRAMPSMAEKVMVSTFHPEHVDTRTRAPLPILVITWK